MSEAAILRDLSVDNVRSDVDRICTTLPTRLSGSDNERKMAEYSRDALQRAGLAAALHEFPGLVSFPERADLHVLSPSELTIEANTLGHSVATLPEGVMGELVDVGSGGFADYEGVDATGKIILTELSYHPARHEKQRIAALKGAVGCVMMNWGHDGNTAVPFGSVKPAWGNPTPETMRNEMPTLPCVGISRAAGLRLRETIRSGAAVRVRLRANVVNGWYPVRVTTGELPSAPGTDFVVVGGHQDSWPGAQATDNAAGNACMFELARVFASHAGSLRRGLKFGFWTGHETGTMVGSAWYVDRNWRELRKHAVAYLQIDQPACAGTTRWSTGSNLELRDFHQQVEKRHLNNRPYSWRRATKTGDASFFGLGVPMFTGNGAYTDEEMKATAMASLGWWHHSLENTQDKIDWDYMSIHLKIYASYIWELCTAPVLPFQFNDVAEQIVSRLQELGGAGSAIGLDEALQAGRQLRDAAGRLQASAQYWRDVYDRQHSTDFAAAGILNDCMKKLSRVLVPLQSTIKGTYGHDRYGYTPNSTMLPALFDVPQLSSLPQESEARWMLETHLVREKNRVADALGDCVALIETTLAVLKTR